MSEGFRKIRILSIVALTAGLLCVLFALWANEDAEPEFDGRPLSYWLDQNATGEFRDGVEETLRALKTIGAPAAPPLVEDLVRTDSTFRRYYSGLRSMLPQSLNSALPRQRMEAPNVRNNAFSALCHIQKGAREQVPELMELLSHHDEKVRMYAILVLGLIGEDARLAIPELERLADHQKLSGYASEALRKIRKSIEPFASPEPPLRASDSGAHD